MEIIEHCVIGWSKSWSVTEIILCCKAYGHASANPIHGVSQKKAVFEEHVGREFKNLVEEKKNMGVYTNWNAAATV